MTDSKVVEAIKTLSSEEQAGFGLFVASPYFHKGFTTVELKPFYELILAFLENNGSQELTKELVHEQIFPGKPYIESRVERLMFELNRLVRDFLLTRHYHREENEAQQLVDYSAIMRNKGTVVRIEKQLQKYLQGLAEGQSASIDNYFARYQIALEEHERHSLFNKLKDNVGLPDVLLNLDIFYYSQRLELLNRFLLQQLATSLDIPEVIRVALSAAPPPRFYVETNPVLLITEKIHQMLLQKLPQVGGFQELMELLHTHGPQLTPKVLSEFYAYLRNYCTILIDNGHGEFGEALHHLHRDNLARGYFYYDGRIQPNAVLSITQHALGQKNIAWARHFIESHKDKIIGENDTRDFYRMNEGLCYFAEKNFDKALDVIPFGFTYSTYHLMARRLELKIYFETNSDLLPSKVDAFKMFVSRAGSKSLSPNHFEMLTNFGNFVLQLSQSMPGDKKRSDQLVARIEAKKLVSERAWLLEKARELGDKLKKQK